MNLTQRQIPICGSLLAILLLALELPETGQAQEKIHPHENLDIRVNPTAPLPGLPGVIESALAKRQQAIANNLSKGVSQLKATVPGAEITISPITASAEVVSAAGSLTAAAPVRSGFDIVKDFIQANALLYGLTKDDVASLHFIGESVSQASGLRMVRMEQMVNGRSAAAGTT
jgi:hypothetical protein